MTTVTVDSRQIGLQVANGMLCILLALMGWAAAGRAASLPVDAGDGRFATVLAAALPGDELVLQPGRHAGPLVIDKPITLTARDGAVVDGGGQGHGVHVIAPDVTLRGLEVINSGRDLSEQHSGIFLGREAHRALVEGNRLRDNLIGIYVWGPKDAIVRGNHVTGLKLHRVNARGNGVQLWRTPGTLVEGNEIFHGRDGIFVTTSKRNIFRNNRFRHTRFAVHYMYTNDSEVSGNLSEDSHVGYALMYSKGLRVRGNVSRGDRDHGFALNYANSSVFEANRVEDGGEKCVFIYNSNKNAFLDNRFQGCGIGVHFTAGSERNRITGNAFVDNRTQVKYVGTRTLDWSVAGRGNYWSDNPAFDLDGDGIADSAYRPNDMMDRVIWAFPMAKLLVNAPAVQMLRWAQSTFPAIRPGGVYDSAPLMTPGENDNG